MYHVQYHAVADAVVGRRDRGWFVRVVYFMTGIILSRCFCLTQQTNGEAAYEFRAPNPCFCENVSPLIGSLKATLIANAQLETG